MMNSMKNTTVQGGQSPQLDTMVTQKDLAAMAQVNMRTIERWSSAGWIPGRVVLPGGKLVRYRRSEILAWIASGMPRPDKVAA